MKNQKPQNDKAKLIGSIVLEIYSDNRTTVHYPRNINPEFMRTKLMEHVLLLGDQIAIEKYLKFQNQNKVQVVPNIPNIIPMPKQ